MRRATQVKVAKLRTLASSDFLGLQRCIRPYILDLSIKWPDWGVLGPSFGKTGDKTIRSGWQEYMEKQKEGTKLVLSCKLVFRGGLPSVLDFAFLCLHFFCILLTLQLRFKIEDETQGQTRAQRQGNFKDNSFLLCVWYHWKARNKVVCMFLILQFSDRWSKGY